ncbi:hypothetical protein AX14_002362, partial [Amanita brunnescens Koide BX004]
ENDSKYFGFYRAHHFLDYTKSLILRLHKLINPLPPSFFYTSGRSAYHTPTLGSPNLATIDVDDIGVHYLREQIGEGSQICIGEPDAFIISSLWSLIMSDVSLWMKKDRWCRCSKLRAVRTHLYM